jgi:hypothetical protein
MLRNLGTLRRIAVPIGLIAVVCVLAVAGAGCNHNEEESGSGETPQGGVERVSQTEHEIYIKAQGNDCWIVNATDGRSLVKAQAGDWVRWVNTSGRDIELTFGTTHRLFGVIKAISYGTGPDLRLQIREDAVKKGDVPGFEEHTWDSPCREPAPGGGIIVCPPGQSDC